MPVALAGCAAWRRFFLRQGVPRVGHQRVWAAIKVLNMMQRLAYEWQVTKKQSETDQTRTLSVPGNLGKRILKL